MSQSLHRLFDLLTTELLERVKSGDASSQDLNVARQFLKDARIQATSEFEPLELLEQEVKKRRLETSFDDYYDDPNTPNTRPPN